MSEILLPDYMVKAKQDAPVEDDSKAAAVASQLPEPCGYKILIGFPKIEDKFESGILKSDNMIRQEEVASVIGFIIKMGPDCYKDVTKFPSGPYCKEGDFVLLRSYAGTRFKVHGVELRLINDDSVECVVLDPRGYGRA